MTRLTMADSVSTFPKGFDAYAGYLNGHWPTYRTAKAMGRAALPITVFLANAGECLDIETGDATPEQAPQYVRERHKAGIAKPVLYTFASQVRAVIEACERAGIHRDEYLIWSAHWTYKPHICAPHVCNYPEADGTQWTDRGGGGAWDESILKPTFFAELHGGGHRHRVHHRWKLFELVACHRVVWKARLKRAPGWIYEAAKSLAGGHVVVKR